MIRHRKSSALIAVLASFSLVAAACGDDDESDVTSGATGDATATTASGDTTATTASGDTTATTASGDTTATTASGDTTATTTDTGAAGATAEEACAPTEGQGEAAGEPEAGAGDLIDLGTFVGDPPEHIDPALNSTLDAYQPINAMYDGLTDIDASDPANPEINPHVAETVEVNDDATEWVFTIREGSQFSDGELIVPSTFLCSWLRASDPDFAGDYSYLMNFIEGGAERLAGEADTLSGVVADDDAMTLTVKMSAPYANFDAVAGFQLFFPMPKSAIENPGDYENGVMVGNGP